MNTLKKLALLFIIVVSLLVIAINIWGALTLGSIRPAAKPELDETANKVVMVFGATGSVGDGLLKAAVEDPDVEKVYVITRRSSSRIESGVAAGKVEMRLHEDYTDYAELADILGEVNTVLWGLGTTSLGVDDATYTKVHVDFPVAFVKAWLAARRAGPMAFHYVTGMGTDIDGEQHWAREKGRAEREVAVLAEGSGLRTFGYRSAYIRPSSEQANVMSYVLEALLRPGSLAISSDELAGAMLEISARPAELTNGALIDNADSIAFAQAYRERLNNRSSHP